MGWRRTTADIAAVVAALAVLTLGSLLVLVPSFRHFHKEVWNRDPFAVRLVTTTVTKTTTPGTTTTPATRKSIKVTGKTPSTTVETTNAAITKGTTATETTTTTNEANDSLLERTLSTGGLILFRLAIVAFAAFIAGAVVQRAVLGRFALKIGPLQLDEISGATAESVTALQTALTKLGNREKSLSRRVSQQAAATLEAIEAIRAQIEELQKRLPTPTRT
jgi:hypothetical protein